MAREREITVTLDRVVWSEFQRRLAASGRSQERGAHTFIINEWLRETLSAAGRGAFAPASPPPAATVVERELEDDDLGLLGFVPEK